MRRVGPTPVTQPRPEPQTRTPGARVVDALRAVASRRQRYPHGGIYAVYALVLLGLFASLLALHFTYAYNSDEVAGIVTLQNWRLAGSHTAWLPADTFVIKAPFYLLVQAVLPNSPAAMLTIALLLNAAAFGLFFLVYRSLVVRQPEEHRLAAYTPLLLLAGLGPTFYLALREPNCRNLEIGIAFVCLAVIVRSLSGELALPNGAQGLLTLAGAGLLFGLFIFNDPMFLFVLVVPLAIVLVGRWLIIGDQRPLRVVVFLASGWVAAQVWRGVFALLHVSAASQRLYFVSLDQLGGHVSLAFTGLLRMHAADFFGQPLLDLRTVPALINFGLLVLMFAAPLIFWIQRRQLAWWQWFVVVQPYLFVATFILYAQIADVASARYLVFEPFFEVITLYLLMDAIANGRLRRALQGLLVTTCLLSLALLTPALLAGYQQPNAHDLAVVRSVRQYGLTKGYANYWSANIHTYLAGNAIQFIPAECGTYGMRPQLWDMDDRPLQMPAARTFYLIDKTTQGSDACTLDEVQRQLGAPAQTVSLDAETLLLVYDGDITARMSRG